MKFCFEITTVSVTSPSAELSRPSALSPRHKLDPVPLNEISVAFFAEPEVSYRLGRE
jgi:hypothetical protein